MISWIVATHREQTFNANLKQSLAMDPCDEMIVLDTWPSITTAYAEGQERASCPVKVYVHDDVEVLNNDRLREAVIITSEPADVGIVGVIGSRAPVMPWWGSQALLGSVHDTRMGLIQFGPGGPCAILDGVLLATRQHIEWDVDAPGWHGYDHDACAQMTAKGLQNICITNGHLLVRHNASSSANIGELSGWNEAVARFYSRWS